jgi:hypothetical protein
MHAVYKMSICYVLLCYTNHTSGLVHSFVYSGLMLLGKYYDNGTFKSSYQNVTVLKIKTNKKLCLQMYRVNTASTTTCIITWKNNL